MPREEWMSPAMQIRSAIREMLLSALLLRTIVFALAMLGMGMDASTMDTPMGSLMVASVALGIPSESRHLPPGTMAVSYGYAATDHVGFLLLTIPHVDTLPADTLPAEPGAPVGSAEQLGNLSGGPGALPGSAGIDVCGLMPPLDGALPDDSMARVLATWGQLFGASDAALTMIETLSIRVIVPARGAATFLGTGFVPQVPVPPG